MSLRSEIMDLPAADRLQAALDMLDLMAGEDIGQIAWLRRNMGLEPMSARVLIILNNAFPRAVSKDAIYMAIWGSDSDVIPKIIDVMICKLRKKGVIIETVWGYGYALPERVEIGTEVAREEARQHLRWTDENDSDLRAMCRNGSSVRAMAYELERTERAVLERIRLLGLVRT